MGRDSRRGRSNDEASRAAASGGDLAFAAGALSRFEPLAALARVTLRRDPPALALRGVALAQLGEAARARRLLERAARAFAGRDPRAHARCVAALGELALARRDLAVAERTLADASALLAAAGDADNARFAAIQRARCLVLAGRLVAAGDALSAIDLGRAPARLVALAALVAAAVEARRARPAGARQELARARRAAAASGLGPLADEVARAERDLARPIALLARDGVERPVDLEGVARLGRGGALVVDACRREVRAGERLVTLARRPVLLAIAAALARAAPGEVTRADLVREVFGAPRASESLRARARVEVARLRRELDAVAAIEATAGGYALRPRGRRAVALLTPPAPGEESALLALLRGGEAWTTSALALALGAAQRTVQRALGALLDQGKVERSGRGRAQRWVARAPAGFAPNLLLLGARAAGYTQEVAAERARRGGRGEER